MSEFLKGNYKPPKLKATGKKPGKEKPESALSNDFEKQAFARLGGSIAFVMKSKTFLWTEGEEKDKK